MYRAHDIREQVESNIKKYRKTKQKNMMMLLRPTMIAAGAGIVSRYTEPVFDFMRSSTALHLNSAAIGSMHMAMGCAAGALYGYLRSDKKSRSINPFVYSSLAMLPGYFVAEHLDKLIPARDIFNHMPITGFEVGAAYMLIGFPVGYAVNRFVRIRREKKAAGN